MYTNVNLAAPVGVLALLGAAFLLFILAVALIYGFITRRSWLIRVSGLAVVAILALYFGVMLLFSLTSHENVLARGAEKYFCEIDCHLAYSVADVRAAKELGDGGNRVTAAGMFRLVTIKTRFDETTISATRGNSLLYPNPRVVTVVDESGKEYLPFTVAQAALERSNLNGTPVTTPLRPSETYSTTFVFDLPANIGNPTLLISEADSITHLLIGHENSLLHKKTRFQI
jgi:hypothetical protein